MKNWPKILASATGLIAIAFLLMIAALIYHEMPWWCVMAKDSPDKEHRAKWYCAQGFDAIFWVKVDGRTVYSSPDFAPIDADFREQIAWDKSGNVVVFEVAGRRLFGYQANEKRALTDEELLRVEYTPFKDLGYEGDIGNKTASPQQAGATN